MADFGNFEEVVVFDFLDLPMKNLGGSSNLDCKVGTQDSPQFHLRCTAWLGVPAKNTNYQAFYLSSLSMLIVWSLHRGCQLRLILLLQEVCCSGFHRWLNQLIASLRGLHRCRRFGLVVIRVNDGVDTFSRDLCISPMRRIMSLNPSAEKKRYHSGSLDFSAISSSGSFNFTVVN
ncbi:hypothetical protein EPI10_000735 [Gossypium australe]|uniref:Uncharacterized protein n=1 Tax=Gossypium australe TaxID=47621 RepID=A0A5B6V960_9ROSI|nr:hypothetical protein EPI10_000735 [Gossypium australe]